MSLDDQTTADVLKAEFGFKGAVLRPSDPGFEAAASGGLWNTLRPARNPQVIAQVLDEADVAIAVRFARAHRLKVAVRGGGHHWSNPSLREGGLLIDLAALNQIVSIDTDALTAIVQPIVSNREIQAALNPKGLSFPSGHCPSVKLSGYLLSGGMSWNHGIWGPGAGSVTAIELITATGDRITASATENVDYFWAARGAGPGFFGIALRYHLALYPLPQAMTASVYYYPYGHIVELARWLDGLAGRLPSHVELSLFAVQAPPGLAAGTEASNGKVALITATSFSDSADEAAATLRLLDSYQALDQCLSKSTAEPTNFGALFDASAALWPGDLRCKVDAMVSNAPLADIMHAVQDHLVTAPSPRTVFMFAIYTGRNRPPATPPDAAFSATGALYGGPWTQWDTPGADSGNFAWHETCVALLMPAMVGHYIGEADVVSHFDYAERSYNSANWARLIALREKYDPDGVFFSFSGGLD